MTPGLAVVGGISRDGADVEFAHIPGDEGLILLKYKETETVGESYPMAFEPSRLSALVRPTEQGWVATAPELGALGYGEKLGDALNDLLDAVEQYLEFLRDDQPELAPEIADHADFVSLLGSPRGVWLASVKVNAAPVE